jgi:hypothetical protein
MSTGVVGAVEQVDLLTKRPDGAVVIIMIQQMAWDDSVEQLTDLQDKLNNYLRFVFDGQLRAHFDDDAVRWVIRVDCQQRPPARTQQFLDAANGLVAEHGGTMEIAVLPAA